MSNKRPKIGLALSSGGAKGLAHIGVIKVLEENNVPIDFIAGSSIGAMIGGLYAAEKDIKQVEKITLDANWLQMLSLIDPSLSQGLISGEKIKNFVERQIGKINFQDLKIPLSVITTDLKTGEMVVITKGKVASAIRASISVPLVFKPVKQHNRLLADGMLSLPVPVKIVKKMGAEIIIAVNLEADYFIDSKNNHFNLYKIADRATRLLSHYLAEENVKNADLVISPKIGDVHWSKFLTSRGNKKDVISTGEKAMKKALPQLGKLIQTERRGKIGKFLKIFKN